LLSSLGFEASERRPLDDLLSLITPMKNFKLIVEYDGTSYCGWQRQREHKSYSTVQGELEKALERLFNKRVCAEGSGRTDTGVHAIGQVASFRVDTKIPATNILKALNTYLPYDIAIKEIKEVPPHFHARFSAKKKWYRYTILNRALRPIFDRQYVTHIPYALNVSLMKKAGKIFEGKHDFSTVALRAGNNKVKEVHKVKIANSGDYIYIDIIGSGFLYKMARRITSVLIDVGRMATDWKDVKLLIVGKKIGKEVMTAPAGGLTLMKVYY